MGNLSRTDRPARHGIRFPRRIGMAWVLAGVWVLGTACQTSPKHIPPIPVDPSGQPLSYKRVESGATRNFFRHWNRQVYEPAPESMQPSGADQQVHVEQWGRPDYIRGPFRSIEGEEVEEWLYYDRQLLFQFVGETLVYDGVTTDLEMLYLRRGYPDREFVQINITGGVNHRLFYRSIFNPWRMDTHALFNGRLRASSDIR